jgi:hypothetical protein
MSAEITSNSTLHPTQRWKPVLTKIYKNLYPKSHLRRWERPSKNALEKEKTAKRTLISQKMLKMSLNRFSKKART